MRHCPPPSHGHQPRTTAGPPSRKRARREDSPDLQALLPRPESVDLTLLYDRGEEGDASGPSGPSGPSGATGPSGAPAAPTASAAIPAATVPAASVPAAASLSQVAGMGPVVQLFLPGPELHLTSTAEVEAELRRRGVSFGPRLTQQLDAIFSSPGAVVVIPSLLPLFLPCLD